MGLDKEIKYLYRFFRRAKLAELPIEWTGKPEDRTPCLVWTGGRSSKGYGVLAYKCKRLPAHRFIYEAVIDKVPKQLDLDHLCRVRHCVNPFHLEPVTRKENIRRSTVIYKIARNNGFRRRKMGLPNGVSLNNCGNYRVRKTINYKRLYLGAFKTLEEAVAAYEAVKEAGALDE